MTWWHYLLLVNLYLVVFYGFYALLLRNETFFQLNRVYLVSAALLSFLIPVIKADWVKDLFITRQVQHTIYASINPEFIYQAKPLQNDPLTLGQILLFVYIAGTVILLGRLFYQLLAVKKLIVKMGTSAAFSFFNRVKIDSSLPGQQTIMEHEQVHVKQWHSADVLLIEAVMIINWFNPVVYFYRKAIKHVHEFIADKKAIERGTSKTEYAYLLLSQTFDASPHQLTNNFFNKSLLKARIIMLNKDESKRRKLLKYGLSAPLFACMLILSAATVKNSDTIKIINKKTEQLLMLNTVTITASKDRDTAKTTLTVTSTSDQRQMTTTVTSVAAKDTDIIPAPAKEVIAEDDISTPPRVELNQSKKPLIEKDTLKRVFNIITVGQHITRARVNGVDHDAVDADKPGALNPKIIYLKRRDMPADSIKAIYLVGGKEITREQMNLIDPNRIKAINVIDDYMGKLAPEKRKPATLVLILKDDPATQK